MFDPQPIQAKLAISEVGNKQGQKQENKTGLPDNLKAGIENVSGLSMDDVQIGQRIDKELKSFYEYLFSGAIY